MWNCGLWSSPRQMNSSRFQEQWSWKVTLLVSFILVFQQILQGESWFIVTELLFSFQRPWWRVICQNFKQVHHFFLSRMATVSKDGTWKIWDIDGEFIWHYNFWAKLSLVLVIQVCAAPKSTVSERFLDRFWFNIRYGFQEITGEYVYSTCLLICKSGLENEVNFTNI